MANPQTVQGNLNRVLTHVAVASYPQLSVTASYMAKTMAVFTFEEDFNDQIPTATGVVNSPPPFVMAQAVISLLRTQPAANLWIAQAQLQSVIGSVDFYSDSSTFPYITLANVALMRSDPGPWDGTDPTVKITLKGTYYVNSSLWS